MDTSCTAHQKLLVFDIETIPDSQDCARLTGITPNSEQEAQRALQDHFGYDRNGNPVFLPPAFHRIVAISILQAHIERVGEQEWYMLERIATRAAGECEEEEMIGRFLQLAAKLHPRFVSYNGRRFDMAVLQYRAMRYGLSAEALFRSTNTRHSYKKRYQHECHCDLAEVLSDYGASPQLKMQDLCVAMQLPGKPPDTSGSTVAEMFQQGDIRRIREYCERDVFNTYLLYLRSMVFRGTLSTDNLLTAEEDLRAKLQPDADAGEKYLQTFLADWAGCEATLLRAA